MPTTSGVPRPNIRAGARRPQPISTRFELVPHQGGVTRRFLAYSSPSRSPNPNQLAVLARPGFVRAAPALPGTTRIRLPSAPPSCCDRISDVGLSPPFKSLRLTAHVEAHVCVTGHQHRGQREGGAEAPRPQVGGADAGPLRAPVPRRPGRGGRRLRCGGPGYCVLTAYWPRARTRYGGRKIASDLGGRSRIRTWVGFRRRIYSPLPLAARATCHGATSRVQRGCTQSTNGQHR